tara:strand:- start:362 stop:1402 length:1041 start_codon:yes stop_codon:yes gene_type:complete
VKSLIYGYGKTGKSFERYLKRKNKDFDIFDSNINKYNKKPDFTNYDEIFCSPGIPQTTFKQLHKKNNNIFTDIDIFFMEDRSIKIGITGTNRKSTTAFHLNQLFEQYDPANLIGNIGNTMLDYINNEKTFSIIELSSFQLDKMKENKLDFGILLNLNVDHLDYHGNFESYKNAKKKILFAKQKISYESDPYKLFEWITQSKPNKIELKNLPFRFETISNNVINDSKSTNYHSLSYALKQAKDFFRDSKYSLIVCGDPKKEDFRKITLNGPEEVFIFGLYAESIKKCIDHPKKIVIDSLDEAFEIIYNDNNSKNILFSPGYPSGDDFKSYSERGEFFNLELKRYLGE